MARKNQKTAQPETEEKPKAAETTEAPPRTNQNEVPAKRSWLHTMIRENAQDFFILLSIILGLKPSPKPGETLPSGKEVPSWFMSAFPWLTNEDEKEYNFALSSYTDPEPISDPAFDLEVKIAAEEFERKIATEGIYDEVKYRVLVVEIHREFIEQTRRPAPKDESGGRVKFANITINNPFHEFMGRLFAETDFELQKQIALDRKLLREKHFLKKCFEWSRKNKLLTIVIVFTGMVALFTFLSSILYALLG